MVKPDWLTNAVAMWRSGLIPMAVTEVVDSDGDTLMRVTDDGIAVIDLIGPMTKGKSSFGGASTMQLRQALRAAASSPDVDVVVIRVDSPGGTVAGTMEAAQEVARLTTTKPVLAHIDDMGASAALWVVAMAGVGNVSANRMAEVGSVGAIAVLYDLSGAFEKEGIGVFAITSDGADLKAAGAPGREITEDDIAYFTSLINDAGGEFVKALAIARGMEQAKIRALRGRILTAPDALAAGLIDHVRSFEDTLEVARGLALGRQNDRRQRESNRNRLRLGA